MRIFARLILASFLALLAAPSLWAATGDFADIPALKARVTDTTGTLSEPDKARIEVKLREFEKLKGSQMVVLIVPTTQPEAIEQYSIRVAEKWKIGRKKVDDGLILLIAKNDRKLRIEVGYGLEGAIPDAVAKRVISEIIAPRFRANDYAGGIEAGVTKLIGIVQGEALPEPTKTWPAQAASSAPSKESKGASEGWFIGAFFFAFLAGGLLRSIFGRFFGAALSGAAYGGLAVWLLGGLFWPIALGIFAFVLALFAGLNLPSGGSGGSLGGGSDWGSSGGDSFSGGGGDFGGGGASGDW
jgi:uncharacterized protein